MTENVQPFTLAFLALLVLSTGLRLWLTLRQLRHVQAHADAVPDPFRTRIPLAAHRKAAAYTQARARLQLAETLWEALVLLGWTLGGGIDLLDGFWRGFAWGPVATGTAVLLSAFVLSALLELPFSVYHTFVVEARFGFNRTTPATFVTDLLKQGVLLVVLGGPLVALVLWLMDRAGALWWFDVWVVWMGFTLLMLWAWPTLIAPLFNRFTPLEDEALKSRIERLLARTGFHSRGIFVMDGSRRSGHGNAYFTGFGRSKRIVFFDTLLETLTPDEIEAVLAHELGHFRRRHVQKQLAVLALLSFAGLRLLGWLMTQPDFFTTLGVHHPSTYAGLLLFLFVMPLLGTFLQPVLNAFSRRHEFEADDFAARQTHPRRLIDALVKLYRDNASTLTPDPLYSAFHDSHPPAPVRIAHLEQQVHPLQEASP
ncbi:MAG: M48 family peptidase [Gammaproteobacteria bacterium]|nr:MAG: M48 family peptidase [Gammaproteobacteria bacterium]